MRWSIILLLFTGNAGCSQQPGDPKAVAQTAGGERPPEVTLITPATNGAIKSPAGMVTRPQQLEWRSPAPGNLEIGAWLGKTGKVIWCAIRNPNSSPLEYNDYVLGYFESVKVLARREGDSDWKILEYRPTLRAVNSAGPGPSNVLKAGEEIPTPASLHLFKGMSPEYSYSFFVSLTEFQWPDDWSGNVDVIVRQHGVQMRDSSTSQNLPPLETAPISINLELVLASIP